MAALGSDAPLGKFSVTEVMTLEGTVDMSLLVVGADLLDSTSITYYYLNFSLLFCNIGSMTPALYDSGVQYQVRP